MKLIVYNIDYFIKEVGTSIRLNFLPSVFSFISIGLIFFIFAMITSGWWISRYVIQVIQEEVEINVYYHEGLDEGEVRQLTERINDIQGVREARIIDEQEAYNRMVAILGKEAHVLEVFDDNPFTSFIEVNVDLEKTGPVLDELHLISGIEHIRDNKEVLRQLQNVVKILSFIGYLGIAAVSISTLIITANIIKLGIYARKDQINSLRLLGASESFIAFPFLLEGMVVAFAGGILAMILMVSIINFIYMQISGTLPFIPLLTPNSLILRLVTLIACLSIAFGFLGSLIGLSSAKKV
ncbi:MAG: permease-like cell division protein FtsX [Bacillota bacterium]